LVITANFRPNEQALTRGIFNTISQLGNLIGLAVTVMIASPVTMNDAKQGKASNSQTALDGYMAAFWMSFAAAIVSCLVCSIGPRKSGKVEKGIGANSYQN
jgi:hypothetical protein